MQATLENEERGLWEIVRTTRTLEERALALARQFSDAALSWTDVVSFTICQERRLNTVFGFDHHFYLAGFRLVPETEKKRPGR